MATPRELSVAERRFWKYYMPKLTKVQVLTEVDRDSLADFCRARAEIADIREQQRAPEYRRVILATTAAGGRAFSNPLDAQLRHWMQLARLAAAELGLSPVSRTRVAPAGDGTEQDDLEDFITAPIRRVK